MAALALVGCSAETAQEAAGEAVTPVVAVVREAVEPVVPEPPPPKPPAPDCPRAVQMIVEFEVVSRAYYEARLQSPIWPGAASGVTWGIGYDGGHQTRRRILDDWWMHEHREPLSQVSGITGTRARDLARSLDYVRTDWQMAQQVFVSATLPSYRAQTQRVFRNGWEGLPPCAKGSLVSLVYNRGTQMTGDRRREMRAIRDDCVPAADTECIASQLRAMTRIWIGTAIETGMRRRRHAEAELALM